MSKSRRPAAARIFARWLPRLERLESRETPAINYSLSQSANWSELGPNVIVDGQTRHITAPDPNGGGSVSNPAVGAIQALAAHPTNSNVMFAAGVNGGVWRTTNAQAASPTWTPISDQVASLSISSLSLDPDDPNRLVAGIGGTADGKQLDNEVVRGELVGVLYTENALAANPTWKLLGNGIAGKNVTQVYLRAATGVPPNVVPGYILVGTDAGVYRSDDGGKTFTNVFQATTNNGVTYSTRTFAEGVYDLAANPRLRDQFYVATKPGSDGLGRQVWRTDDGGKSWGTVTDAKMQLNDRTVNVQLTVRDVGAFDNQVYVAVSNDTPTGSSEVSTPGVNVTYGWPNDAGVLTSVVWSTNQGGDWTRMDAPRQLTAPESMDFGFRKPNDSVDGGGIKIISSTVHVLTPEPHRMKTGDRIYMRNVYASPRGKPPTELFYNPNFGGNHGYYTITVVNAQEFTLDNLTTSLNDSAIDTIDAYWQRVVGANPGENSQFLKIVASPTDENIVYLGGDNSQFKFVDNNATGPQANSFTGTFWVGDRFQDPTPFGSEAGDGSLNGQSYQWQSLTDGATSSLSAPGGDTRDMTFDADGNLWVATGTGVYHRSVASGNDWASGNGDIRVGQFWSASYDALNNVLVGAMQDTGQTEESAAGSLRWNSLTSRAGRNGLLQQEYAYNTFVDNSQANNPNPALRRSVRYTLSSDFTNVRRREFDRFDNLLSDNTLNFADAFSKTTPYSGLTGTDLSLTQDVSATIVMALNKNNPARGVYGLTSVYEDSDPNGQTGFIVNKVTPAGMTGRVRALAYGGKRDGVNYNQILYIGTDSGQLFIRGEFGTTYGASRAPATGLISGIELDPDDWRHAFVLQGGRVYETTTAGLGVPATSTTPAVPAWTDVTANLVTAPDATTGLPSNGGLTTEVRAIALYDPKPGEADVGKAGDVVLLAGGRGGVFRRTLSACGTDTAWSEYGVGLPNTVVQHLDMTGNRLTAGTFGRGVWTIDDVSPTLSNTIYLDVTGDGANNSLYIEADPLDPNAVILDDGKGNTQKFSFGQFDAIRVKMGAGKNVVVIDSNGPGTAGGTTKFVDYPISVDMGGGAGDELIINSDGSTGNVQATINGLTVGAGAGDTLFGGCGSVSYKGLQNGILRVNTGSGNDNFFVQAGTLAKTTVLNGGAGNDSYTFAAGVTGTVVISDPSGANQVVADVAAGVTATYDSSSQRLTIDHLAVVDQSGVGNILLKGLGAGAGVEWDGTNGNDLVYLMQDPTIAGGSQILSAGLPVRFVNMSAVAINTLGGADTLEVGSNGPAPGGLASFVNYAVVANLGGDAGDQLVVNDSDRTTAEKFGVTATTIGANPAVSNLFGPNGSITYSGLGKGGMQFNTGTGNNVFLFDADVATTAVVNDAGGSDELVVLGTTGNDAFSIEGTTVRANALTVQTSGIDQFTIYGNGGYDTLSDAGTAGDDSLGVRQTGLLAGTLVGFPVAARYEGVEQVNVSGGAGTNSFSWEDRTNTANGTPTNRTAGVVFVPTGAASGALFFDGGAGTTVGFGGVNGNFVVNGNPTGATSGDVLSVLGVSSTAAGATDGELTAPNGSDTIVVNDAGLSITNASLGVLRGVSFGLAPSGRNSFSTVYVKGGNEIGTGDSFFATTTTLTNLVLDGGDPTTAPGDTLSITTTGQASSAFVNDPAFGPPQTRITDRTTGAGLGYLNFEGVSATYTNPSNGKPVSAFNPPAARLFAAATDAGVPVQVKVFNTDGSLRFNLDPFPGFTGGARVAVGDVTGDGFPDVVVSAGPGAAPHVKVYDGVTGAEVMSFYAYDPAFRGGVSVAVGYFNSDKYADIVIGAGAGGGPHVKVIDGHTGAELQSFFAFDPGFTGGVSVAAGDFAGNGSSDIVVGAGAGGGPHVKVFDGQSGAELESFFAFDQSFNGGVSVAAGDLTGDGRADVIVGAGAGGSTHVVAFDGTNPNAGPIRSFIVNDPSIPGQPPVSVTGGVRVSAADLDGDGLVEILTGRGKGSRPFAQFLRVSTRAADGSVVPDLTSLLAVNTFGDTYSNGIFVGG